MYVCVMIFQCVGEESVYVCDDISVCRRVFVCVCDDISMCRRGECVCV